MTKKLKYANLTDYLKGSNQDHLDMTFDELNGIVTIPDYAYRNRPAWANPVSCLSSFQHGWIDANYVVSKIDMNGKTVTFSKSEREAPSPKRRKSIPKNYKGELRLTIPPELEDLTTDQYLMVELTKNNSDIVEACIQRDSAYNKGDAKNIMQECFGRNDFGKEAYQKIIGKIATENSTRTSKESIEKLAEYCADKDNKFLERLQEGEPELVDTLIKFLTDHERRKDKSLCSKLCRYLNEWHFGEHDYTINDSVVRTMLPYYLAYYKVNKSLWQGKKFESLTYVEFYAIYKALREQTQLNNHQLDHLIWYAYKNDGIRREVAKALAEVLVNQF